MDELKRVFKAARAIKGHTFVEAAGSMGENGYSETTLRQFFDGKLEYPDKVNSAIRGYIYDAGLIKSVKDLGLDPNATKGEMQSSNSSVSL